MNFSRRHFLLKFQYGSSSLLIFLSLMSLTIYFTIYWFEIIHHQAHLNGETWSYCIEKWNIFNTKIEK